MNIGGIDVGTSGVKCAIYDETGKMLAFARRGYSYVKTKNEYCLDGKEVWRKTQEVLKEVAAACDGKISGLSVSSIGEACVLVGPDDRVLAPSILYNDKRGLEESCQFIRTFGNKQIYEKCGIGSNGTCSLEKLKWINDHESYFKNTKYIFLFEDFITYCLTGERIISYSLASRTMGFDYMEKSWWNKIFEFAGIDLETMSVPQESGKVVGTIRKKLADKIGIKENTIIFTGGHDHSCCTLGAGMISEDVNVNISGSGDTISYLLKHPLISKEFLSGQFCCAPYTIDGMFTTYGLCAMSGTILRWYKNTFWKKCRNFYDWIEKEIFNCETNVIVFPGFSALGTPDFHLNTTGAIDGLTLKTTSVEIYKAIMESVVFHLRINQEILSPNNFSVIRIVGGGSNSNCWNQMKADIMGRPVETVENKEAGTVGTAIIAGMGLGIYKNVEEAVGAFVKVAKTYFPNETKHSIIEEKYQRFLELYQMKTKEESYACK